MVYKRSERLYRIVEWDRWADDGGPIPDRVLRSRGSGYRYRARGGYGRGGSIPKVYCKPRKTGFQFHVDLTYDDVKDQPEYVRIETLEKLVTFWRGQHLGGYKCIGDFSSRLSGSR